MKLLLFGKTVLPMFLKEPGNHLNYQKDDSSSNSITGDFHLKNLCVEKVRQKIWPHLEYVCYTSDWQKKKKYIYIYIYTHTYIYIKYNSIWFSSAQFNHSVMSDTLQPYGNMPGFPVHHQLPELAQTHVH